MNIKNLIRILGFIAFLIPTVSECMGVFPDLSRESDEQLTRRVKKGVAEVTIGMGLQTASHWVPKLNAPSYGNLDRETFGPRTVRGMGSAMVITGARDLFFGLKEKYTRHWITLDDMHKGGLDLATALLIYGSSSYMPGFFYEPFLELGGQGASTLLCSYIAMRGLNHTTKALTTLFINTNITDFILNRMPSSLKNNTDNNGNKDKRT